MKYLSAVGAAFSICASTTAISGSPYDVAVGVSFRATFGSLSHASYSFQGGSSFALPDELKPLQNVQSLPLTGVSYTSSGSLSPAFLGIPIDAVTSLHAKEDDQGMPWGWIGAGAAIVAGVALASGGSDDKPSNSNDVPGPDRSSQDSSGFTDENTCVGPELGNPNHVDADCVAR